MVLKTVWNDILIETVGDEIRVHPGKQEILMLSGNGNFTFKETFPLDLECIVILCAGEWQEKAESLQKRFFRAFGNDSRQKSLRRLARAIERNTNIQTLCLLNAQ